ncbi:uncharacterized protein LOC135321487 isoform X2 [Camelus dromedarius]|uniref:uncharacterized protein LOC135321487 isoform X2 n=1 Tax=Camelus dromedarius TaxID=9838 RepID=UPI003119656F
MHKSCLLQAWQFPRDPVLWGHADSQGVAVPGAGCELLGQNWALFWALSRGCQTGKEWKRRDTDLPAPRPEPPTPPPCSSFYVGLVPSSSTWSALGRRGTRDPEDPDGEHPPTCPAYFPMLLTHITDLDFSLLTLSYFLPVQVQEGDPILPFQVCSAASKGSFVGTLSALDLERSNVTSAEKR